MVCRVVSKSRAIELMLAPALNQEQRQVALEHLKAGASISAVSREFDTSRQTIMRLRDDAVSPELPE